MTHDDEPTLPERILSAVSMVILTFLAFAVPAFFIAQIAG